tara:strand:+ start:119478 stop:119960 length:483 start_codon:yes stop_codon:yes gene_type:complete
MSSLISDDEKTEFKVCINDHFDTFKVPIIVYRPGKTQITLANAPNFMHGYGAKSQSKSNTTIIPDTGKLFYALETIKDDQSTDNISPLQITENEGEIRIEVEKDMRDYILADKVERIVIFPQDTAILDVEDGKFYNLDSQDAPKNFLGLTHYVFILKSTE